MYVYIGIDIEHTVDCVLDVYTYVHLSINVILRNILRVLMWSGLHLIVTENASILAFILYV